MIVSIIFWFVGTLSWKNQSQADTHNEVKTETGEGTALTEAGWWEGGGANANANANAAQTNCTTAADGTVVCS
jgi:hypothetical protein